MRRIGIGIGIGVGSASQTLRFGKARAEQRAAAIIVGRTTTCRLGQPPGSAGVIEILRRRRRIRRMSCMSEASESIGGGASTEAKAAAGDVIVQYVVLRRDLIEEWPMGSVVTQGCHASVAAVWENKDDVHTLAYCSPSNLDSMHKVSLEVKSETQLVNLSEKLKEGGIIHKLWIEQPENYPTCLATKPYPKSLVSPFFKKLKLCK